MVVEASAAAATLATVNQLVSVGRAGASVARTVSNYFNGDIKWLYMTDAADLYSMSEIADINAFLKSAEIVPLLQLTWIGVAINDDDPEARSTVRATFKAAAVSWCVRTGSKWHKKSDTIFDAMVSRVRALVPRHLSDEHGAELAEHTLIWGPLDDREGRSAYISNLLALASDLDTLTKCIDLSRNIGDLASKSYQLSLAHLDAAEHIADRNALYVERTVTIDGKVHASGSLVAPEEVRRLVLLGNPGAGKTSLVNHVAGLSDRFGCLPVLVCKCREYVSEDWNASIESALERRLVAIGIGADPRALTAALLLGHLVVVFDGLDEITDIGRREEMTARIARFCVRFPLVSTIVTSRAVGYERTPLPRTLFELADLDEYSEDQSEEYAERWFRSVGRGELFQPFVNDIQSIRDIARNPLLLSLLCSLYRARGHLPTNRHGVYHQCAELLYRQWDAQRQIAQSEDLPDYGTAIMCSIAHFFWNVPSATNADESQLRKLIAVELQQGGASDSASQVRASDFLEFCKDRLWLLVRGAVNSRGEPTFEFAHRTFLEYFAAEYLARGANRAEDLAESIRVAYARDPTSVMPVLLIQSYDDKRSPGATAVYSRVLAFENPVLALRLMNAKLPAIQRQKGFKLVENYLSGGAELSLDAFEAILAMYRDPREQFVQDYLSADDSPLCSEVARGWAAYCLSGRHRDPLLPLANDLESTCQTRVEALSERGSAFRDFSLLAHCALGGSISMQKAGIAPFVFFRGFEANEWGAGYFLALERRRRPFSEERGDELANYLCSQWANGHVVPKELVQVRTPVAAMELTNLDHLTHVEHHALFGLYCILAEGLTKYERRQSAEWLRLALNTVVDVTAIEAVRAYFVDLSDRPDRQLALRARDAVRKLPAWVNDWMTGKHWITSTANPRELGWRRQLLLPVEERRARRHRTSR
ncbi:hypothetical protein GCM10009529_10450 [Micropruina glycogenica]